MPWLIVAAIVVALAVVLAVFRWQVLRQPPDPRLGVDDPPPEIFLVVPPGLASRNGSGGPVPWTGPPTLSTATPERTESNGAKGLKPAVRRGAAAAAAEGLEDVRRIEPVHYDPPSEGTLHILPGRLEVLGGSGRTEELRFVRLPGRDPVITFGRSEGEPHAHVRLESPTVSRTHAAIRFKGGAWHIENRSRTNPVTVNGKAMSRPGGAPVRLADGDVIEMGAVCLRFRER